MVIFDLDGTVLNTIGGLTNALNAAREMNGLAPQSKADVIKMIGNGTRLLIERSLAGEKNADELFEKVFSDYKEYYNVNCDYDTYPYDGITGMLQSLKENGILCAVVTNKPDIPAKILINEHFGDLICETRGNVPGIPVKPDPTFVLEIMREHDVRPERCVYVGDSDVDIRTGKASGIDVISVDWGFRSRDFLIENGAGAICSDPGELLALILG